MSSLSSRNIIQVENGFETVDGAGVVLKKYLGQPKLRFLDPFLLLDQFKSDNSDDYIEGFPDHPHRGFQTVTYLINGLMEHKDNKGGHGTLYPGSLQFMTAGRGIIHSEIPKQVSGLLHGYQFWLNLPNKDKFVEPSYQDISAESIPQVITNDAIVKVIAGNYQNVEGAIKGVVTEPLFLDVQLKPSTKFTQPIPSTHNAFVFIVEGSATFGSNDLNVSESQMGVFELNESKNSIDAIASKSSGVRFLLLAAQPIGEKIFKLGPFVLGSQEDLDQAFDDFHSGLF